MLNNTSTYEAARDMLVSGSGVVEVADFLRMDKLQVLEVWRKLYDLGLVKNSPYSMVQERVRGSSDYPWKVMVLCALMNRTHARQVRPIISPLFLSWPIPRDMAKASTFLEALIQPLGFMNRRAKVLREMSEDYASGIGPGQCRGVGKFAIQAIRAFVFEEYDFEPEDGFLGKYVRWRRTWEIDL